MNHDGKELADRVAVALGERLAPMPMRESPGVLSAAAPEGVQLEAAAVMGPAMALVAALGNPPARVPAARADVVAKKAISLG